MEKNQMKKVYQITIKRMFPEERGKIDYKILDWYEGCEYDDTIFTSFEEMLMSMDALYTWPANLYSERWKLDETVVVTKTELDNPYPKKERKADV